MQRSLKKSGIWIFRSAVLASAVLAAALAVSSAQAAPGNLDPGFGSGGTLTSDLGGNGGAGVDAVVQPDGKIVVLASTFRYGTAGDFALARYNPDGTPDTTFGTNGLVFADTGGYYDDPSTLLVQPDGKLVAVGSSLTNTRYFSLARFNADGSPDASFGTGGVVLDTSAARDFVHDAALQADGKIVVAGGGFTGDFQIARYNADGTPDTGFGLGGGVVIDAGGPLDQARGVAVNLSGQIEVVGIGSASGSDIYLTRMTPTGAVDTSFGANGVVTTDVAGGVDYPEGIVLQSDGRIVVVGQTQAGFLLEAFVARYSPAGVLDAGFGSGGVVTTSLSPFGAASGFTDAAVQSNGKIVAGGFVYSGGFGDFAVARYSPAGVLDAGFGSGGIVSTDFAGRDDFANALALQPDGKIISAGQAQLDFFGPSSVALARYLGEPIATHVSIDIKPGTTVNPMNLRSAGLVPAAILTSDSFDAATVDPHTVCFGDDDHPAQRACTARAAHIEDVNGDGKPDLLLSFQTNQTGIDPGDSTACLTGTTFAGINIEGCDSIRTL